MLAVDRSALMFFVPISVPAGIPSPAIKYKIVGGHGQTLLIIIIIISRLSVFLFARTQFTENTEIAKKVQVGVRFKDVS